MPYSEFTLESVLPAFQLEKVDTTWLFSEVETIEPSDHLMTALARKSPFSHNDRHREGKIGNDCC